MKRFLLSRLLPLALSLAAAAPAQTLQDDLWLGGTDSRLLDGAVNTLKAGSTTVAEAGAAVDLSLADLTLSDDQIAQVKVNGLVAALAAKQPLDATLTALAAVTTSADKVIYATASDAFATMTVTSTARDLLDDTTTSAMRTTLSLVPGTHVQAWDADLDGWATKTPYAGNVVVTTGKSITVSNTLTLTATDGSTLAIGAGGTLGSAAYTASTAYATAAQGTKADAAGAVNGIIVSNGSATFTGRTITGSGLATLTNGNGTAGNPLVDVPAASNTETITGTSTLKAVVPAGNKAALDARFNSWVRDTGYIYSDGATSQRAQIQIPGARGNLAGAALASWVGWVEPKDNAVIAILSSSSSPAFTTPWILYLSILSGNLNVIATGAGGGGVNAVVQNYTGFLASYPRRVWLEVRLTKGTTVPVILADGMDITGTAAAPSVTGTRPDWLSTSLDSTYHLTGLDWPDGEAPLGQWLNAHLTQAESDDWRTKGKIPAWVKAGGSQVVFLSNTFNNEHAGWDNSGSGGSVTDHSGYATFSSSSPDNRVQTSPDNFIIGKKYWFSFEYRTATVTTLYINNYANNLWNSASVADSTWRTITGYFIFGPGAYGHNIAIIGSDGGVFDIRNFSTLGVGALSLPSIQPIPVIDDVTDIGGNCARLVGMKPITDRRDFRIVARTATNGNEQLLGGELFDEASRYRLTSWTVNNLGSSRTVSLGNASAGTQFVSGMTAAGGLNDVTLATRFNGTVNLWANSNGTDTLVHTIAGQRIGNN